MRYTKPHYYDTFQCLAGACPDTCCAGWQIYIDEESLERYEQVKGTFGNRVANSIDWEEGAFLQCKRRCAFLNEENLCDLYAELGPDSLCDTCRMYPRHIEEFDGLREMTLSLSCPEAARMMLTCQEPVQLLSWETEEEETSFEEDEMDYLLFTRLEDAREVMFSILQDRSLDIEVRMAQVLALAEEMKQCVDDGVEFEIDDVIEKYRRNAETGEAGERAFSEKSPFMREDVQENGVQGICEDIRTRYERCCREFPVFHKMELLRPQWGDTLQALWEDLYADGLDSYQEICRQFDAFLQEVSKRSLLRQQIGEQLMMFFIHTYFCGAVYDAEIAVKVRLAVFSVRWIQELVMHRWMEKSRMQESRPQENGQSQGHDENKANDQLEKNSFSMEDVIEMSWRYAREVEHSDVNLEILEEALLG